MKFWHSHSQYQYNIGVKRTRALSNWLTISIFISVVLSSVLVWRIATSGDFEQQNPIKPASQKASKLKAHSTKIKPENLLSKITRKSAQSSAPLLPALSPALAAQTSSRQVTTTVFWVGEPADADNGYIANAMSAWDDQWQDHYGGVDDPKNRNGYFPASFIPKENPFYIALPYSDLTDNGKRKPTAGNCPLSSNVALKRFSWCKNSWIAITSHGKTVYAQWEDVGPFETDDTAYVFGTKAPRNSYGARAGLDVSPAVRDYLGLSGVDTAQWMFISESDVPSGPWKQIITTSLGYSY